MRYEYTDISDMQELPFSGRIRDIYEDTNDIVQDIPEDVAYFELPEEELEVQDIPDDIDWDEMARGMSSKERAVLEGSVNDISDHFHDEGEMPDIADHFNDEGEMPDIADHFSDEGEMPDVPDHFMDEGEIPDSDLRRSESQEGLHDAEDLDTVMEEFKAENWEGLSDLEREEAIERLGEYAAADLGLENPPRIEFYQSDNPGDFGAYSEADNTIRINELNIDDPAETADTITHETRHCWQHERAENPQTEEDLAFADNFANYITPDTDFEAYQDQIVEADAREYADRYRQMI